jgi:hypothetical protein
MLQENERALLLCIAQLSYKPHCLHKKPLKIPTARVITLKATERSSGMLDCAICLPCPLLAIASCCLQQPQTVNKLGDQRPAAAVVVQAFPITLLLPLLRPAGPHVRAPVDFISVPYSYLETSICFEMARLHGSGLVLLLVGLSDHHVTMP